jgi:hypothetical protein
MVTLPFLGKMKDHHETLLKTGDVTLYSIVYKVASDPKNGHPLACSLFMMYCLEAYRLQSLVIPFNFSMFSKSHKLSRARMKPIHNALLEHKCIEYVKGEDNRKKYIKILV